jgi:hypothetical protein
LLDHLDRSQWWTWRRLREVRICEPPFLLVGRESPSMNRQTWDGFQSAEIRLLPQPDIRVEGCGIDERGEIADPIDVEVGKDSLTESSKVKPFAVLSSRRSRAVAEAAVVKIETVKVDVRARPWRLAHAHILLLNR